MTNNRDLSFDVIKGILIYLVVLGHCINVEFRDNSWESMCFHVIYSFHMPLFVFISGIFYRTSLNRPLDVVITKRFKRVMIPTIFYTFLMFLVGFLFIGSNLWSIKSIFGTLTAYWFMICIFVQSIVSWILYKNKTSGICVICIYLISLLAICKFPFIQAVDCQIIRMFAVFNLGVLCSIYGEKLKKLQHVKYIRIFLFFVSVSLIVFDRIILGYNLSSFAPLLRILDGIACCFISYKILLRLVISNYFKDCKVYNCLIYIGQLSMPIYLVHLLLHVILINMGGAFYNHNICESIILSIFVLLISMLIIMIQKRIVSDRYKYIIGL